MLLTEVIGLASSDSRVQTAVRAVLEICAEISFQPVMLLWPLLYAGANAITPEDRCWVKSLFETFSLAHCYDLIAAVSPSRTQRVVSELMCSRRVYCRNNGREWTRDRLSLHGID